MSYPIKSSLDARNRIVVGVDGKRQPSPAVQWAADVASRRGLGLALVYAYGVQYSREVIVTTEPSQSQRDFASKTLTDVADAVAADYPDLDLALVATKEDASTMLAEATKQAWLVVLGATTMSGLAAAMLGKTSTETIRKAKGAVAIVPETEVQWDKPVVLAIDLDRDSAATKEFAFEIAHWVERPLRVVHAWGMPRIPASTGETTYDGSMPHDLRDRMAAAVREASAKYPDVEVSYEPMQGDPVTVLRAVSEDARVMIMGSRGMVSGIVGTVAGSTSRKLIDRTKSPLIVITAK